MQIPNNQLSALLAALPATYCCDVRRVATRKTKEGFYICDSEIHHNGPYEDLPYASVVREMFALLETQG